MIDFNAGFYGKLRSAAGPLWNDYVNHEFLHQLQLGTLPANCFKRFLTQDYLFLISFARASALLATKANNVKEFQAGTDAVLAITTEWSLHIDYCKEWGISEQNLANIEEAIETIAYTRYVLDIGHIGDRLDLLTALIACLAGYAEVGLRLAKSPETIWDNNPYAKWIKAYDSEAYMSDVRAAIQTLNKAADDLGGEARFKQLRKIFNTVTRLETAFWQMGLNQLDSRF